MRSTDFDQTAAEQFNASLADYGYCQIWGTCDPGVRDNQAALNTGDVGASV